MAYQKIIYEKKQQIGYITLNSPDTNNEISHVVADELVRVSREIGEDEEIRVVVITGSGKAFSAEDQATELKDATASSMASAAIASLNIPVIASINGDAIGAGLEIALSCDIRISAEGANFALPGTSYGFIPSGGGTQRLPRIVGRGKALEMILMAETIDTQEAFRVGLINKILSIDELGKEVENLAQKLASKGPISARYAKEAISKGMDMTLRQGLKLEADLSFLLQTTTDRTEGINAFLEKRTPEFKGE